MVKKQTSGETAKTLNIQPLGDRVLVKPFSPDDLSDVSRHGIIIPETVDKEKPEQGKVLAAGDGRYEDGKLVPMRIKIGDKILFSKYGYDEVKVGDEEYYILKEDSILAIIK